MAGYLPCVAHRLLLPELASWLSMEQGAKACFPIAFSPFFSFILDLQGSHRAAVGKTCPFTIPAFQRHALFPEEQKKLGRKPGAPGFQYPLFPLRYSQLGISRCSCISKFPFGPLNLLLSSAHSVSPHLVKSPTMPLEVSGFVSFSEDVSPSKRRTK